LKRIISSPTTVVLLALLGISVFSVSYWNRTDATTVKLLSIVYVDSKSTSKLEDGSLPNPFHSISAALEVAASGADIYVASGDYQEYLQLTKPLQLHGSNPDKPRLMPLDGAAYVVNVEATGLLENFVLLYTGNDKENLPVAVEVRPSASDTIVRDCDISGFQVGIEINGAGGNIVVENNNLQNNVWGMGSLHTVGKVQYINNSVISNGYGLYCAESNADVGYNNFTKNQIGVHIATRIDDGVTSTVTLHDNQITDNSLKGIWFDQGTANLMSQLDLGSQANKGANTIGNNGTADIVNDAHTSIEATGNQWLTKNIINAFTDGDVITN